MKIIFIKYSDVGRKEKYRIGTGIFEEKRKKIVFKKAMNEKSKEHITRIFDNKLKLEKAGYNLNLVNSWIKNEMIFFEYIEGKSLDSIVIDVFFSSGKKSLFNELKKIKKIVDESWTPEIANLDMTLDNMIKTEKGDITVIDYEWIHEGEIHKDFIFYRLLEVFYNKYGIYFYYKFSFDEMVKKFYSEEVINELKKLSKEFYSKRLDNKSIPIKELKPLEKQKYLEIYFDYGDGKKMKPSIFYFDYKDKIEIDILIPYGVKNLRVDPKNSELVMRIEKMTFVGKNQTKMELSCTTNAVYTDGQNYIFTTDDPQMYFSNVSEGILTFIFQEIKLEELLNNKKIIIK